MVSINEEDKEFKCYFEEREDNYLLDISLIQKKEVNNKSKIPFSDSSIGNSDHLLNDNHLQSSQINSNVILTVFKDDDLKTKETTKINFHNPIYCNEKDEKDKNNSFKKEEKKLKKKRGRKRKDEADDIFSEHDKFTDDNIIRKIKTNIFKYILSSLNESLKFTKEKFYPLNAKLNKDLKKDINIELFNKRIYKIYMSEDLNGHHININDSNKNLIRKIFEEKIEIKTINILNMTFIEVLNHIREKDLQKFLQTIKEKEEKKNNKNLDEYMEKVCHYLNAFIKWFDDIDGRNSNKKMKK